MPIMPQRLLLNNFILKTFFSFFSSCTDHRGIICWHIKNFETYERKRPATEGNELNFSQDGRSRVNSGNLQRRNRSRTISPCCSVADV